MSGSKRRRTCHRKENHLEIWLVDSVVDSSAQPDLGGKDRHPQPILIPPGGLWGADLRVF